MKKRVPKRKGSILQILIPVFLIILTETTFSQCYLISSEKLRQIYLQNFGEYLPERQGPFTSGECKQYIAQMEDWQSSESRCDCNETQQNVTNDDQDQKQKSLVPDRDTQLMVIKKKQMEADLMKRKSDSQKFDEKKQDLLGKLKPNKSLEQLKTSAELSQQGSQNVINNQLPEGKSKSESAFTDAKTDPDNKLPEYNIPVSPPSPVDHQKKLFEFIDQETKLVQAKIIDVQKEKTGLLEKKIALQDKIAGQKADIEQLEKDKSGQTEEAKTGEIDSLLLLATQMLRESEELNEKATNELKEKEMVLQENESMLNKYQDAYSRSKEHPEESEALLKELQRGR